MNNTNKKITALKGNIIFPLVTGQRALISHNDQTISTSTVMAILEVSEERITFETRNTLYCVAPEYSEEIEAHTHFGVAAYV